MQNCVEEGSSACHSRKIIFTYNLTCKKGKRYGCPCAYFINYPGMKTYGGVEIKLQNSWPRHLIEVKGQLHVPAALRRGKKPTIPIVQGADWAPEPVWMMINLYV
jgi:hypothetical protein